MSHRPATPAEPFATGVIAGELAALDAGGAAPAWIKVTPAGRVTTRDGRSYAFDPAALVARFTSDAISIPVDLDHSVPRKAMFGEAGTVVGWAPELEARADGLYARIDWLEAGKAALAARTHRFVSPTFHHDDVGNATWLHSVALVPAPALAMPAVASAGGSPQEDQPMLKKIAAALGLSDAADETACLSALASLKAETVSRAVHEQALASLSAATTAKDAAETTLTALTAEAHKKDVDALLDDALAKKRRSSRPSAASTRACAPRRKG
ncbi:phage protease [Ancylobacter dichloromethanicus]